MKERPILFSAPMVRALLDGSKTQTRRVVKPVHLKFFDQSAADMLGSWAARPLPYGQPGDRLWVRENGWERPERSPQMMREGADTWAPYYFDADGLSEQDSADFKYWGFKRRPSIHMPRAASRILLEVADVRVERLQDISEADAKAEGAQPNDGYAGPAADRVKGWVKNYRQIWESINGPDSWAANPWVWVVEFKKVTT